MGKLKELRSQEFAQCSVCDSRPMTFCHFPSALPRHDTGKVKFKPLSRNGS